MGDINPKNVNDAFLELSHNSPFKLSQLKNDGEGHNADLMEDALLGTPDESRGIDNPQNALNLGQEWNEWFQSPIGTEGLENSHMALHNRALTRELDSMFAVGGEAVGRTDDSAIKVDDENEIATDHMDIQMKGASPYFKNRDNHESYIEQEDDQGSDTPLDSGLDLIDENSVASDLSDGVAGEFDFGGYNIAEYGNYGSGDEEEDEDLTPGEEERIAMENTFRNQLMLQEMAIAEQEQGFDGGGSLEGEGYGNTSGLNVSLADTRSVTWAEADSVLEFNSQIMINVDEEHRVTTAGGNLEDDGSDDVITRDAVGLLEQPTYFENYGSRSSSAAGGGDDGGNTNAGASMNGGIDTDGHERDGQSGSAHDEHADEHEWRRNYDRAGDKDLRGLDLMEANIIENGTPHQPLSRETNMSDKYKEGEEQQQHEGGGGGEEQEQEEEEEEEEEGVEVGEPPVFSREERKARDVDEIQEDINKLLDEVEMLKMQDEAAMFVERPSSLPFSPVPVSAEHRVGFDMARLMRPLEEALDAAEREQQREAAEAEERMTLAAGLTPPLDGATEGAMDVTFKLEEMDVTASREFPSVAPDGAHGEPGRDRSNLRAGAAVGLGESRLMKLSRNYAEKKTVMPAPPPFSCNCADLPLNDVDKWQREAVGNSLMWLLPDSATRLRLTIRARVRPSWEDDNKPPDDVLPLLNEFMIRTPHITGGKVMSTADARSRLFKSFYTTQYDHPAASHVASFARRFRLDFRYIAFDRHMQIMGTYTVNFNDGLPGLTPVPPYLQKNRVGLPGCAKNANLLDVDFDALPDEVFALVPLFLDEDSYPQGEARARVQDVKFQFNTCVLADAAEMNFSSDLCAMSEKLCDATELHPEKMFHLREATRSAKENLKNKNRKKKAVAATSRIKNWGGRGGSDNEDDNGANDDDIDNDDANMGDDDSDATSAFTVDEIPEAERGVLSRHATMADKQGWMYFGTTSFARLTEESASTFRGMDERVRRKDITYDYYDCNGVIECQEAFLPFVLFRRRGGRGGGWAVREANRTLPYMSSARLIDAVMDTMRELHVLPVHALHVEHCVNCEEHTMSSRHVPGSYDAAYTNLVSHVRQRLPPFLYYRNKLGVMPSHQPRIGTFDVICKPYHSDESLVLYSKISTKRFPKPHNVLAHISSLVLPERVAFGVRPILDVHVFDAYHQKVMPRVYVKVVRIDGRLLSKEDEEYRDEVLNPAQKNSKLKFPGARRRASTFGAAKREERELHNTTGLLQSSAPEAAKLRHSKAFSKVRSWGRTEMEKWFTQFEDINDRVLYKASMEGVVDGISLLRLSSEESLKRWGVLNKRSRRAVLTLIQRLSDESDIVLAPASSRDSPKRASEGSTTKPRSKADLNFSGTGQDDVSTMVSGYTFRVQNPLGSGFRHCNAETVVDGKSNGKGLFRCTLEDSGSYVVQVFSDQNQVHTSHIFRADATARLSYFAAVKPLFGRIAVLIDLDDDPCKRMNMLFANDGLLVSVVNLRSGKRHIVFCGETPVREESDLLEDFRDLESEAMTKSRNNKKMKLKKFHGLSDVIQDQVATRSRTYGADGKPKTPVPQDPDKSTDVMSERMLYGECVIPVGVYYSETTGSVLRILPPDSAGTLDFSGNEEMVTCRARFGERLSLKNHRRNTLKTVQLFQKLFRKYQNNFAARKVAVYLTLKRGLRNLLKRIRRKIAGRKATKIGATWRMYVAHKQLKVALAAATKIETRMRIILAKKLKIRMRLDYFATRIQCCARRKHAWRHAAYRFHQGRFIATFFAALIQKYNCWRYSAATMLQCMWRFRKANRLLREERERALAIRALEKFAAAINRKVIQYRARNEEQKGAERERNMMIREELLMKRYIFALKQKAERERKKSREKAKAMERKRAAKVAAQTLREKKASTKLQTWYRSRSARRTFVRIKNGINTLQYYVRWRQRVARGRKKSAQKPKKTLRFKKKEPEKKKLTFRERVLVKLGLIKLVRVEETGDILKSMLHKPVIKCQAIVRMHLTRRRYFMKRKSLGLTAPLLFRYSVDRLKAGVQGLPARADKMPPEPDTSSQQGTEVIPSPHILRGVRGFLLRRNRRLRRAVTKIQAAYRGHVARTFVYKQLFKKHGDSLFAHDDDDASIASIREPASHALALGDHQSPSRSPSPSLSASPDARGRSMSPASPDERAHTLASAAPSPLSEESPLHVSPIRAAVHRDGELASPNDVAHAGGAIQLPPSRSPGKSQARPGPLSVAAAKAKADIARTLRIAGSRAEGLLENTLEAAGRGIGAATAMVRQKAEKVIRSQQEMHDRVMRQMKGNVNLTDGLLQVHGLVNKKIPRIDRRWYMAAFPHTSDARVQRIEEELEKNPTYDAYGSASRELRQGRLFSESSRSELMFPFTHENVHAVSFYTHLTDLARYKTIEVALFIEKDDHRLTEAQWQAEKSKGSESTMANFLNDGGGDVMRGFHPVFYGYIKFRNGQAFGPAGGRYYLTLHPNMREIVTLPKTTNLLNGLNFVLTMLPVAVPSSALLKRYFHRRPAPALPMALCDAPLLEAATCEWDNFKGAALASLCYRDRLLVSARTKGAGCTLFEYRSDGLLAGNVTSGTLSESLGSIVQMAAGSSHVACCGNTGTIMFTSDLMGSSDWATPLLVPTHDASIRHIACVTHAGMDIFFTLDRKNFLGVNMLDAMDTIRSFTNPPFTNIKVNAMVVFKRSLYLGLEDGNVMVVDVSKFLDGSIHSAVNLKSQIVKIKQCMNNYPNAGIESLCCYSGNALLNLDCEDRAREEEEISRARSQSALTFEGKTVFDTLEGHVVCVGGGDAFPVIKIMSPHAKGMRELATLRGHQRGVTSICADAVGRFIVSGSAAEHAILIWDALSFVLERKIEDVMVGSMTLGPDCLIVTTSKAPFIRLWRVPEEKIVQHSKDKAKFQTTLAHIGLTRSMRWCFGMLKRGQYIPATALGKPTFLDQSSHAVIERWFDHYSFIREDHEAAAEKVPALDAQPMPQTQLPVGDGVPDQLEAVYEDEDDDDDDEEEERNSRDTFYIDERDRGRHLPEHERQALQSPASQEKDEAVLVEENQKRRKYMSRVGRFSHYSDDEEDDSDEEEVDSNEEEDVGRAEVHNHFPPRQRARSIVGVNGTLNFQEKQRQRLEARKEKLRLKHISERQAKLRPRLTLHLMDQEDSDDENPGQLSAIEKARMNYHKARHAATTDNKYNNKNNNNNSESDRHKHNERAVEGRLDFSSSESDEEV